MRYQLLLATSLIILLAGCATPSQLLADAEVDRLCAIDGGVKVYEKISMKKEKFDKYGNVKLRFKEFIQPQDEYYLVTPDTSVKEGDPTINRYVTQIIRRKDGKVMGESIAYARRGGDFMLGIHPSSYRCPAPGSQNLSSSVFMQGTDEK